MLDEQFAKNLSRFLYYYHQNLIKAGFSKEDAMALTANFQLALLSLSQYYSPNRNGG